MRILKWKLFIESIVGEEGISNIDKYIVRMDRAMDDKLFFIDDVDFDVIVDFGCANGTLLSKIKITNPDAALIGYDVDDVMVDKAHQLLGDDIMITDDWSVIVNELKSYKNPLLNLSSVIHEVYSYSSPKVVEQFWKNIVFGGLFKYIVIRDMMPSNEINQKTEYSEDIEKVRARCKTPELLADFESKWGSLEESYKIFTHYLLKYRYPENWTREVKENYLPITIEEMKSKIPSGYKIEFEDHFSVPFIQDQLKKDFDVQLRYPTHTKLIINNTNFKNP